MSEPSPLRIIKRRPRESSIETYGGDEYNQGYPMRTSSAETDDSLGSAPESPRGDWPLTVKKKRQQPWQCFPGISHARKNSHLLDRHGSEICHHATPYTVFKSSDSSYSQAFNNDWEGTSTCPRPFQSSLPHPLAPDALVLVPHITIIPEVPALDESIDSIWVAVQITGQVCESKSGQPLWPPHFSGFDEAFDSGLYHQKPPHPFSLLFEYLAGSGG